MARVRKRGLLSSEVRGQMVNVRVKGVNQRLYICVCVFVSKPGVRFLGAETNRRFGISCVCLCVCVYQVGSGVVRVKEEENILTSLKQVCVCVCVSK